MTKGAKPGERRGGRKKGTPNRRTVEKALKYERDMQLAEANKKPLATEVLEKMMFAFAAMVPQYQQGSATYDADQFERWGKNTIDAAHKLAPYQSPTFRAIVVAPPPDSNQLNRVTRFTLNIFNQDGKEVPMIEQSANGPANTDH